MYTENAEALLQLNTHNYSGAINDLTGIQDAVNMTTFYLSNNTGGSTITTVDLSNNSSLHYVLLQYLDDLTSISLPNNVRQIGVNHNDSLTSLDLSHLNNITSYLQITNNDNLASLTLPNVSSTVLTNMSLHDNSLYGHIDLSGYTGLKQIYVQNNLLDTLTLGGSLTQAGGNNLTGAMLTHIDATNAAGSGMLTVVCGTTAQANNLFELAMANPNYYAFDSGTEIVAYASGLMSGPVFNTTHNMMTVIP